jgi:hypothetical protein
VERSRLRYSANPDPRMSDKFGTDGPARPQHPRTYWLWGTSVHADFSSAHRAADDTRRSARGVPFDIGVGTANHAEHSRE